MHSYALIFVIIAHVCACIWVCFFICSVCISFSIPSSIFGGYDAVMLAAIDDLLVMVSADVLGTSVSCCLCSISGGRGGRDGPGGSVGGGDWRLEIRKTRYYRSPEPRQFVCVFPSLPW
uniref:Putative secreted protein n=1 Tax=Ixodes ricinus TaxID=34613 RepID=A0A6B0UMI1_IXORI